MKLKSLCCPNCGGNLGAGMGVGEFNCPYCGSLIHVDWDDNDVELIKANTELERAKADTARMEQNTIAKMDLANRKALLRFLVGGLAVLLLVVFGPGFLVRSFTSAVDERRPAEDYVCNFTQIHNETFQTLLGAASEAVDASWNDDLPDGWSWSEKPQIPVEAFLFYEYGVNTLWFAFQRDLVGDDRVTSVIRVAEIPNIKLSTGVSISKYYGSVNLLDSEIIAVDGAQIHGFRSFDDIWTDRSQKGLRDSVNISEYLATIED